MKFILEYKSYGPKKDRYDVGDVVYVTYWYLREPDCPSKLWNEIPYVKARIVEVKSNKTVRVSYDVEGSPLFGAPGGEIPKTQIISKA